MKDFQALVFIFYKSQFIFPWMLFLSPDLQLHRGGKLVFIPRSVDGTLSPLNNIGKYALGV